jgi:flavin reductase (DIM6/NTAB) family NADH-FMN oxidoreductase RutF
MTTPLDTLPQVLGEPLEVPLGGCSAATFSQLLGSIVIPRPIAWISSMSADAVPNLAPYAYFSLMGSDPAYVVFASDGIKDTLGNLRAIPEFVVNIVSVDLMEQMHFTATDFPIGEDERAWAGLTSVPSASVRPGRVAEAKAHLECRVTQIVSDGNTHIVLAKVVHVHVDPSIWNEGRVDPRLLNPVARLASGVCSSLGDIFALKRSAWTDVCPTMGKDKMPRAVRIGR